jgi:hypothetical protein
MTERAREENAIRTPKICGSIAIIIGFANASILGLPGAAQARLVKLNAEPPTVIDLPAFGPTGPYLKIRGTFEGELDPSDRRNEIIVDINLAPKTGNRKIFYDFGNRWQQTHS